MVALYQANEPAFIDGDMNRLSAGAVLTLPPDGVSRAIEPAEARRMILVHLAAVSQSPRGAATADTATGKGVAGAKPDGAPVLSQLPSDDHLRLARPRQRESDGGSSNSAHGDDIVALQRALAESRQRIALLERDLENIRKLLALKGEPLVSVNQPERSVPELAFRVSGNVAAAERNREGTAESGTLRGHAGGLLATFLVGFAVWVVMPVKTVRAWLKRRQRQDRATIHTTLDLPRTTAPVAAHFVTLLRREITADGATRARSWRPHH
jgi:Tfp pilus assembly protein FimV